MVASRAEEEYCSIWVHLGIVPGRQEEYLVVRGHLMDVYEHKTRRELREIFEVDSHSRYIYLRDDDL